MFTGGLVWQVVPMMDPAVMIFFVLSGYVIAYTSSTRENNPTSYFVSRAARIYSVVIPALALTLIADQIGSRIEPAIYTPAWDYQPANIGNTLACLLFVNRLWFFTVSFGSMASYWSLGYEVWYYVLFGIALFTRGRLRIVLLVMGSLIVGPRILALAPIWVLGAVSYYASKRFRLSKRMGWLLFGGSLLAAVVFVLAALGELGPVLKLAQKSYAERYLCALIFAANIVGFEAVSEAFTGITSAVARPVRWLAGMTFTLYLAHLPLAELITALSPLSPRNPLEKIVVICGTLAAVALFAEVTERRKKFWHHGIQMLVDGATARLPQHSFGRPVPASPAPGFEQNRAAGE